MSGLFMPATARWPPCQCVSIMHHLLENNKPRDTLGIMVTIMCSSSQWFDGFTDKTYVTHEFLLGYQDDIGTLKKMPWEGKAFSAICLGGYG